MAYQYSSPICLASLVSSSGDVPSHRLVSPLVVGQVDEPHLSPSDREHRDHVDLGIVEHPLGQPAP